MSLFSLAIAAGLGAAAVKVSERVKENKTDGQPKFDDYVAEAKVFGAELIEKGKDAAPVVMENLNIAAEKVKPVINQGLGAAVDKIQEFLDKDK